MLTTIPIANRYRASARCIRFASCVVGLAADAPPLLGGGARSGSIRRLPMGRLHCARALATRSVRCLPWVGITARSAHAAGPRRTALVTSPCRRMPGCNRGSARQRPNAPPGRVLARRASAAVAIPYALLRVCQDRLCTYKVTWVSPPLGGETGRTADFTTVREELGKTPRGPYPRRFAELLESSRGHSSTRRTQPLATSVHPRQAMRVKAARNFQKTFPFMPCIP